MNLDIVIVFDIDGTITVDKRKTFRILKYLNEEKIPFVFNTSRLGLWKNIGLKKFNIRSKDIYSRCHISKSQ